MKLVVLPSLLIALAACSTGIIAPELQEQTPVFAEHCQLKMSPVSLGADYFRGCDENERLFFVGETVRCKEFIPAALGNFELFENVYLSTMNSCGGVDLNMASNFRDLCEASIGDFARREPFRSVFRKYESPISCISGPISKRAQQGSYHSIRHVNHYLRPQSRNTSDVDVYVPSRPSTSKWWFEDAAGNEFFVMETLIF